jgi:hypothetical protein
MNQRVKRSNKGKGEQDISGSTMHTGGHVSSHSREADPVVRTPQKATGDVPAEKSKGLAKASPFFKKLKDTVKPKSKAEEKKALAEASEDKKKKKEKKETE